jgi:RbsD / FucU transport protein family
LDFSGGNYCNRTGNAGRNFPPKVLNPGPYYGRRKMNRKIMLKNLTRLHTPELLHTLASIGHGDDLAIVDAHFLAVSMAQRPGQSKHALFTKIERHALTRGQKRHPRSSQRENCGRMAAF